MQFLTTLRALVAPSGRAKPPTASTIAKALAEARAEHEAATIEISKLQASRLLALIDPAERAKHTAALSAAKQRLDDAALAAGELERRLAEAEATEQEAERRRRYAEAKARRDAVAAKFPERFREHSKGLLDLLAETAAADAASDRVNDDLPEGADPIPFVEAIRGRPGLPRRVIRVDVVDLWAAPGSDQPLGDDLQGRVERERQDRGDGQTWGVIRHVNKAVGHHSVTHYVRRRFEREVYIESTVGEVGPRLHRMALPALHVDEPALYEPRPFPMDASDVLRALERAASQPVEPPEQERREKRVAYRLVRDEPPAEPQPSTTDSFKIVLPETAF